VTASAHPTPPSAQSLLRTFLSPLRRLVVAWGLLALALTLVSIYEAEHRGWHGRQEQQTHNLALQTEAYLEQTVNNLRAFALIGLNDAREAPERLQPLFALYPAYQSVQIFDAQGQVLVSLVRDHTTPITLVALPQARWWQETHAGRVYLSPFQLSPQGDPYLLVAVPVENQTVALAQVDLTPLWQRVREARLGQSGLLYVVDASGRVLAHPDAQVVLRGSVAPVDAAWQSLSPEQPLHQEFAPGLSGGWVERTVNAIPGHPWWVISEVNVFEVHRFSLLALGLLSGATLLLSLLFYRASKRYIQHHLLQPLEQLRHGAAQIRSGRLQHRLTPTYSDELNRLAQEFNAMAQALESQQAALARQAEVLQQLYRLGLALATRLEPESVLQAALDAIFSLFPATREAHCFLRDEHGGLVLAASRKAGQAPSTPQPPTVPSLRPWSGEEAPRVFVEGERALVLLRGREEPLGVLRLESPHAETWGEEERRWLGLLADQVAIALENSRLYTQLQHELAERRAAEEAMRRAQADLEERIYQRTMELRRLNRQLTLKIAEQQFVEERLRRQNQQLEALREISLELTAQQDLNTLLKSLVQHALDMVRADGGGFYLYEPEHDYLVRVVSLGEHSLPIGLIVRRGEGLSGRVLESGEPMMITDYRHWEGRIHTIPEESLAYAVLALPVRWGEDLLGVLNVVSYQERNFTQEELNLLNLFTVQAAIVIRNARILETERRQRRRAEALATVNAALTSSLELQPLLHRLLETAVEAIPPADRGSILLYDPQSGELRIHALYGYSDPRIFEVRFPAQSGYAAQALSEGRPLVIPDAKVDGIRYDGEIEEMRQVLSAMAAPLRFHGEPIGVITLDCTQMKNGFNQDDLSLLAAFADQAAIAIHNARLYERERQLAITDGLTQIYNRRYALELAEREIERARRYQRPLAMILADIDHFKRVNDTYGHLAGDAVLYEVAQRCRRRLRDFDVLGRYGGEEFLVVLPETEAEEAMAVAERLRRAIGEAAFEINGNTLIHITLSFGVVSWSEDHPDLNQWLMQVDEALYRAKESGRNRAVLWSREG